MVPTYGEATALWKTYQLPQQKQQHCHLVATLALFFASKFEEKKIVVEKDLLLAAALLHDIDKNMVFISGEDHPDAAVRILTEIGMGEVARIVKTHPLHAILDPVIAPKTWEEKILFLSDKMVKYDIIGVEERFRLWKEEPLPAIEQKLLIAAFSKVKELEQNICTTIGLSMPEVIQLAKQSILGDKGELL
jgi:putative nucleotidyltransferase with HDIG domain